MKCGNFQNEIVCGFEKLSDNVSMVKDVANDMYEGR